MDRLNAGYLLGNDWFILWKAVVNYGKEYLEFPENYFRVLFSIRKTV